MSVVPEQARLLLERYDRDYLDRSAVWLADPETRALTMTPAFDRATQLAFFEGLATRRDYHIWGVRLDGVGPIGAAGIKNVRGALGEYWGYIGEKDWWGTGLGASLIAAVEARAPELGLEALDLKVAADNERAIRAYRRAGYRETGRADGVITMRRELGR